ncbi:unnamed protein product [Mytilus edulis]|uniref:DUF6570 domain-containing protein n=1 Tax=Mytilus edulis TaxID=6550 RepID=A0A8S3V8D6_MYTED|nr:unnamed protein product [Mytilus edulis]
MIAGASQDQWFEVTGVSISIFGQQPIIKTNSELSESHTQINTSELKLSEILQTGNKDSHELPKTQENITLNDNISPEIIELNINKSIGIDKINEVHINEVIMDDESDIEILSSAEIFMILYPNNNVNDQAIYLQHNGDINHYEVVTAVTQESISLNGSQSRQEHWKKYQNSKSEVPTKKMKIDENQMTDSDNKIKVGKTESKVFSKMRKKGSSIQKYQEDENYRDTLIDYGIHKYQEDEDYRKALIQSGIEKYKDDNEYREKLKQASIHKYEADVNHKEHVKQASIQKYANDDAHRIKIKQQTSVRRESLQEENKQISEVQICKKDSYNNSIFDSVTTNKYEHKCTDDCKTNCAFEGTCRISLWICYTCHRKMLKGKIPADSFSNSLLLEDVPVELKRLNSIEQQLIAQNIPFMKIMALPKGGQKGVHGPVDQNIWYKDVTINNEWINPIPELDDNQVVNEESDDNELVVENEIQEEEMRKSSTTGNEREIESEPVSYIDDSLRGVQLDTCLQPADIGQEALDLCFDQVFNIAPAENNSPLSVLQEPGIEAKTFPVHFLSGKNTFDENRDEKLTIGRYFNLRLMSVENRFARDTSYIFFSQYLRELTSVISNVQISLRKQCPISKEGKK